MEPRRSMVLPLLSCLLLVAALAGAGEPLYRGNTASNVQLTDNSMPVRQFDPFNLAIAAVLDPALESSLRCTTQVQDGAEGRKGAKTVLKGQVVDLEGNLQATLPTQRKRTDRNGYQVWNFDVPLSFTSTLPLVAIIEGQHLGTKKATRAETTCDLRSRQPCQADDTTACLRRDDRFQVQVDFSDGASSGPGEVLNRGFEEALWFFSPNNTELLVKVLDACGDNGHFWVFYAATTNVEFEITVTDTETGAAKVYDSQLGQPANAVTDTAAFATCP